MFLTSTIYLLSWSVIFVEILLLVCIGIRKYHCDYPAFVLYLCYRLSKSLLLRSLVAFSPDGHASYFYAYWVSSVGEDVFLLAVLLELARHLFAPHDLRLFGTFRVNRWLTPHELNLVFKKSLFWLVVTCIVLTAINYSNLGQFGYDWWMMALARTMARAIDLLIFGTTLLGIALSRYLSIPWRRRAGWIAAGLLIQSAFWLWFWTLALRFSGTPHAAALYTTSLQWVHLSGTLMALLCWAGSTFIPEHAGISLSDEDVALIEASFSAKGGD